MQSSNFLFEVVNDLQQADIVKKSLQDDGKVRTGRVQHMET